MNGGNNYEETALFAEYLLFALLAIAVGAFSAAGPHTAWYWSYGWRYKNAEPSDLALSAERIGGVIAVVVGVLLLIL